MIINWPGFIADIKDKTGLSGAELARKIDVRPQLISEIETGRSKNPGSDFLLKLLDQFGINPTYLVGKGPMFLNSREQEPPINRMQSLPPDEELDQMAERMGDIADQVRLARGLRLSDRAERLADKLDRLTERNYGRIEERVDMYLEEQADEQAAQADAKTS